jgi:hypothetical protein
MFMKKSLLLSIVALSFTIMANSQTYFNIIDPSNGTTVNDLYLEVQGSPNPAGDVMEKTLLVTNISGDTVEIGMTRTEVDVEAGTKNTTCWFLCPLYGNAGDQVVYTSPFNTTVANQATDSTFSAKVKPQGVDGCSLFKYEFFNSDVPAEREVVWIKFFHNSGGVDCSTLGVVDADPNLNKVNIYPNPAATNVKINIENNYNITTLQVVDMLGKVVKNINVANVNGTSNIDVSSLNNGFYFVKVLNGNKVIESKKLMINK